MILWYYIVILLQRKKMYLCCNSGCFLNLFITKPENWINIQDNAIQQNPFSVFFTVCWNLASWNTKCVLKLSYYTKCVYESGFAYWSVSALHKEDTKFSEYSSTSCYLPCESNGISVSSLDSLWSKFRKNSRTL